MITKSVIMMLAIVFHHRPSWGRIKEKKCHINQHWRDRMNELPPYRNASSTGPLLLMLLYALPIYEWALIIWYINTIPSLIHVTCRFHMSSIFFIFIDWHKILFNRKFYVNVHILIKSSSDMNIIYCWYD